MKTIELPIEKGLKTNNCLTIYIQSIYSYFISIMYMISDIEGSLNLLDQMSTSLQWFTGKS